MRNPNNKLVDPAAASPSTAANAPTRSDGQDAAPAAGVAGQQTRTGTPARTGSLQREWSRAFILVLVALVVGVVATVIGVRVVTDQIQHAAAQHRLESEAVAEIRAGLDAHEQAGLQLLAEVPIDTSAFLQQQKDISAQFDATAGILPDAYGMRATLREARTAWQDGLSAHGLWDSQVASFHGNRVAETPAFAASGAKSRALLANIRRASLDALDDGVAYGAELQQMVSTGRTALFARGGGRRVLFPSADDQVPDAPRGGALPGGLEAAVRRLQPQDPRCPQ